MRWRPARQPRRPGARFELTSFIEARIASALVADLVIAGGDLGNVLLHDLKAGQYSIGLLVFRLSAANHALQFAAHGRNLTLDRANRFLNARGVLAEIAGEAANVL